MDSHGTGAGRGGVSWEEDKPGTPGGETDGVEEPTGAGVGGVGRSSKWCNFCWLSGKMGNMTQRVELAPQVAPWKRSLEGTCGDVMSSQMVNRSLRE